MCLEGPLADHEESLGLVSPHVPSSIFEWVSEHRGRQEFQRGECEVLTGEDAGRGTGAVTFSGPLPLPLTGELQVL